MSTPRLGPEGYVPVVPPRIGPAGPPPDPALVARLREVAASDVSDAVGRLYTMDPGIRALYAPMRRTVGPAFTVKAHPGDNLAIHGALGMVQDGAVLVVDWLGYHDGCGSGARLLAGPIAHGLAGVVVDGGWRDIAELQAQDFPVFGRGEALFSPAKREAGEIGVPVCCGGVVVEPGDIIVADEAGVAVVPRRHLADVVHAFDAPASDETPHPPLDPARSCQRYDQVFTARLGLRD